ncbi:SWIB-domain-containing protein [Violaceomyces palustris]|uniref:SWIB-domain-containing protein n=1 Tax=Violaceomyces palustris TaxID=1673888 RepID=A0ACD0P5S0_9BASI|nr:SWIB-domain-containing protein [Violaceomyces palustris]
MAQVLDPEAIAKLKPAIKLILAKADLSSVTRKEVRERLEQLPPGHLPPNLDLAACKKHVDVIIRQCFDQIQSVNSRAHSSPAPQVAPTQSNGSTPVPTFPGGLALPGLGGVRGGHTASTSSTPSATASPSSSSSKPKPPKPDSSNGSSKAKAKASDSAKAKPKKKAASSSSSSKKKAPKEEDEDEDDDDDDKPRKKRASNPNNPFNRPLILDAGLAEVCGGNEMPRHAVVKNLWAYIKANNLQNEQNKRQVICDEKLTAIFGKGTVDSFEMAKLIGSHLKKKEDLA